MNTHSLFGYLFIALFSLLVVSCYSTPDGVMSSLSQAEKIMESRPDSAMAILQHIPTPETLHGKAQADYSLLMTQAMDKNYINFTSDSLIKFAVGYYGGHTEDLVAKGKSFYYYGRVMESLDKVEDAIIIRKSKFPQNPKRSVRFSGKRTKRSVQKRKARNTQKAETKVL